MLERDLPATFPNLIALLVLTTGGRVQVRVQNMPCTVTADHPMMERMPTARQTYKHISKDDVMMRVVPTTRQTSAKQDSHNLCPPDDTPDERIPPKPPYPNFPSMTMLQPKNTNLLTLHEGFAHKEQSTLLFTPHRPTLKSLIHLLYGNSNFQGNLLQSRTAPLELQQWWGNPQDATAILDKRTKWETMKAFYIQNKHWPSTDNPHSIRMDGQSPLDQTMFQAFSAEVWLMIYAWHGPSDTMVRPLHISNAMWNQWQGFNVTKLPDSIDSWDHNGRRKELTPSTQQPSKSSWQHVTTSSKTQQWEHMRAFHFSIQQWPATVQSILQGQQMDLY